MNSSATGNAANEGSSTQQQQHVAGCASAPRIEAVTVYAGSGSQVADKFHEHAFELGKVGLLDCHLFFASSSIAMFHLLLDQSQKVCN